MRPQIQKKAGNTSCHTLWRKTALDDQMGNVLGKEVGEIFCYILVTC